MNMVQRWGLLALHCGIVIVVQEAITTEAGALDDIDFRKPLDCVIGH